MITAVFFFEDKLYDHDITTIKVSLVAGLLLAVYISLFDSIDHNKASLLNKVFVALSLML